ncbi:MAG TPA: hypothetical protein VK674_04420 [Candidatus Limnocylindria bacterium]|nr:hypothetical protein [Candidatus Limnocylindria bacterium]
MVENSPFHVVGRESEDRNTLRYEVEPSIPLSRYRQVVGCIGTAFEELQPDEQVGVRPDALANMQHGYRVAITNTEAPDASVVRLTFTGFLERFEAPASDGLRQVMDSIVDTCIDNLEM